ncbi:MAG: tRNA (adenosine(37)-N6)-threonylcarbamoyltransferase complex dimerization subunit type 1 TsaB [Candidatus Devosia symbiotica]|nr:tRNA (adenosine(37)-N6)-threonylcarbamoyltransferase complex dimerization subunit type 1 TsaB [Candidatus Devosia symbiotica]
MSQTSGIVLAIDTAAPRLQLALLLADGSVDVSIDEIAAGQAEAIFGRIAALLARNGVGYADLGRVVTTTGPGSFTGLRIGLSAARGIGLARGIAVIGVPSLLALSLSVAGPSTVLLDARRDEAYFQVFAAAGVALTPPDLLPMALAQAATPPGTALIGSLFVDIALLARYGAVADPASHVPEASYVRDADAKPQTAGRVERIKP